MDDLIEALTYAHQLELMLDATPLLYIRNDATRFTHANQAVRQLVGSPIVGMPVAWWMKEIVNPDDQASTQAYFEAVMAEPSKAVPLRNRLSCANGTWAPVRWFVHVDPDSPGGPFGLALGVCEHA